MKTIIDNFFSVLAIGFDKVPFINKFKGYRSAIGFVALATTSLLELNNIGDPEIMKYIQASVATFIGLSLNSKGR